MAKEKIDLTKIEGYDTMSAEEKVKALEGYEYDVPEADYTGYVKKEIADQHASDASMWKKKFRDTQTESERREAEIAEQREADQKELEQLRKDRDVAKLTNKYIELGYSQELAESSAIAQYDNDTETLFKNQQAHIDNIKSQMKDNAQKQTPAPDVDNKSNKSNADTKKMTLAQRQALYEQEGESAFEK